MSRKGSGITDHETTSQDDNVSARQTLFHRLECAAHRWWPRFFDHPDAASRLERFREHDRAANAKTTPPPDEFIDLRCEWAVEFYGPAHIDSLLANLQKLGWDRTEHASMLDPAAWISRARQQPHGGALLNLGVIRSEPDNSSFPNYRTATLPPHVQYATGRLYSLTSSLICIVMGFVFEGDYCARFDKALRTDRQTYTKPSMRGHRIYDPRTQKIDHIRQIRAEMADLATKWFQQHLPGLFSSGLLGGELPTCELVTLRMAEPFAKQIEDGGPSYLSLLGLSFQWDVWCNADNLGLKLTTSKLTGNAHRYHAMLAVRESNLDEDKLELWGGRGREPQFFYIDETINGLLSRWAMLQLLEGYSQHLSAIRDSTTFRSNWRLRTTKVLKTLIDHVSYTVDIAAITAELIPYANNYALFSFGVETFKPSDDRHYEANHTLLGGISFAIVERATWLQKMEQSLRDHLVQYGSLLGVVENIYLQSKLKFLTWIIIAMTLAMLWATSDGMIVSHVWNWIRDLWGPFDSKT